MAKIVLESSKPDKAVKVIKEVLETETLRIKYSLKLAKERLKRFEKKYNISSDKFIKNWTAEDLKGKDMEYVEWAGEYRLFLKLKENLTVLRSIAHVTS